MFRGLLRFLLRFRFIAAIFVLVCIVIIGHYTGLLTPVENVATRIIQPAQTRLFSAKSAEEVFNTDSEDMTYEELSKERNELQTQVKNLLIENAHLRSLVDNTELLEDQLTFLRERSFTAVHAKVTSRSTEFTTQSLIINKGSDDGVIAGLPVIVDNGILLGVVKEVKQYSSTVLLITSFQSMVSTQVENEQQSQGIIQGDHNLTVKMQFIPQFDDVQVDQPVFTSGSDELIPKGLLVGQVQEVLSDPNSLFQEAIVSPFYTNHDLAVVSIILP